MTRQPHPAAFRSMAARHAWPRRQPLRSVSLAGLVFALYVLFGQTALAQSEVPVARLLPETTLFAVFAQPGSVSTATIENLFAELDVTGAKETVGKLVAVLGEAAGDVLDLDDDYLGGDDFERLLEELSADCPALGDTLGAVDPEALTGRAAAGVSISSFAPLPTVMVILRPDDTELGSRLFESVTSCYDSGVAMSEGSTPLYVLGDGSDFPVVVAKVDGTLLLASDPDVLRGMVRRATGANEPSLLSTRVGGMTRGLTSRGLSFTLNLAGVADLLAGFLPTLGGESGQAHLINRVLATLRVINGVAAGVTLDEAGLVIDSVVTVDREAAAVAGELELLDLLSCAGCAGAEPTLIPADPAGLVRSNFSLPALVAWLDSWLADMSPLIDEQELDLEMAGEVLSVNALIEHYLGSDLDALALDWLGTTWFTAQLDVYGTDVADWLQGPGSITTVPVSSEAEARAGLRLWGEALDNGSELLSELLADDALEGNMFDGTRLTSMLSIRPITYRGVEYDRVRSPFSAEYGVAVFGGHLVLARPARAMNSAIDVHLGAAGVASGSAFGPLLASQPPAPAGFQIVDLPRYLTGLATLTDLAAGPMASALWLATQTAIAGPTRVVPAEGSDEREIEAEDLPTFDDLVRLTDLATEALLVLAERTGVAIGSSEIIDGVHWSTMRVPLR